MIVLGVIVYVLGLLATAMFIDEDNPAWVGLLAAFWPVVLPFALVVGFFFGIGLLGQYLRDKLTE